MTTGSADGPRIGELFLAEIVGRELGFLGRLSVDGIDHPSRFTSDLGDRYDVLADGAHFATVDIGDDAIDITLDRRRIRVENEAAIKQAIDELGRSLTE